MARFLKTSEISIGEELKDPTDPRLRHIVQQWDGKSKLDIGIVGIPFDYGIVLSGGRPGAAEAPDAIRAQIKKYGTAYHLECDADLAALHIADCGNVDTVAQDSNASHMRMTAALDHVLRHADVAVTLGGGNDISYATIKALAGAASGPVGGMNVDAHFDVRPVVEGKRTSGTPYRLLLEEQIISGPRFFEVGVQSHVNAKAHYDWLKAQGARIVFLSEVRTRGIAAVVSDFRKTAKTCIAAFVSIDMDAMAQAFAPGTSAPSPDGLFPQDILLLARLCGEIPNVRLLEIMEVNPAYDVDNRTARLAANIILEFLAGYTKRGKRERISG